MRKMAKVALLIGVSQYGSGLNPLPAAVKDVEAMRELLVSPEIGGFAESDVIVLKNPERQPMEEAIESLFAGRHKDDLVMLFFSGHGIKDDTGRLYLATRGTRKTPQGDLIRSTAVSSNILHDSMSRSRSKRQVVILDSCFSGAFAEGLSAKDDGSVDIRAQLGGEGRAVLTSSSSTQYSFEYEGSDLSLYTRFLVEGIKTGAADQDEDEVISIDELHEYASRKVREIKPEAKPEIFAVREGFNIRLMRVPPGDPRQKYRKEVARYIRRGEISLIGRRTLDWKQTELGLSRAEAKAIEDEVLEPYRQKFREKLQEYEQAFTDLLQHHETISEEDRSDLQHLQSELELRNEDTLPIEAKITAQFKARQQQLQSYERAFTEAIRQEYPLSQAKRHELEQVRLQLELSHADAAIIADRITAETETYHRHLQQYRQSFAAAIREQYPLNDARRHQLRQQQQALGLEDIDVAPIEAELTAQMENYQQKLEKYEQEYTKATQRKHHPSETVYTQLQQTWQSLALNEVDAKAIEERITAQINQYQTRLRQYEQEFTDITEQEYPLSQSKRQQLRQRQQALNLDYEDVAAIETPIIQGIEEQLKKQQQYEQVFSESIQYEYPLTEETRDELKRFQQILGLSDQTVSQIEERILTSNQLVLNSSSAAAAVEVQPAPDNDAALLTGQLPAVSQSREPEQRVLAQISQPNPQSLPIRSNHLSQTNLSQTNLSQNDLKQTVARFLSQQPRRTLLLPAIALASLLLITGIWSLAKPKPTVQTAGNADANVASQEQSTAPQSANQTASQPSPDPAPLQAQPNSIQDRISFGNRILINRETGNSENPVFEAAKQRGVAAMERGDYQQAAADFSEALQAARNAPETLIYLNNAQIGAQKSYVLAASVPITGPNPGQALEMLRGFAQAQNQINQAGGINGVRLKLQIFDDSDDPEIAKQIASAIVQDPEVLGVIGHWSSNTSLATAPIYDSGQIPFITPVSTTTKISNFSPYVFRTNLNTETGGKALADYALTQLKKTDVAVFSDSKSAYSQELESQFSADIQQGGGNIVDSFDLSEPGLSVADSINQAIKQGAKAILLIPAPTSVDKALQVITTNRKRLPLIGDVANLYTRKTLEVGGKDAVGMVMALPWHTDGSSNAAFPRQAKELWKADVSWATATSYNAAQAMIEALKQETDPTRAGIQETLAAPNFSVDGASGEFRFLPSGDVGTSIQLVEIQAATPSRSGTGFDFVSIR